MNQSPSETVRGAFNFECLKSSMLSEYDPFSSDTTFLDRVISDLIDETVQARGIVPVQNGNTDDQVVFSTADYNTIFQGTYFDYSLDQITHGSFIDLRYG